MNQISDGFVSRAAYALTISFQVRQALCQSLPEPSPSAPDQTCSTLAPPPCPHHGGRSASTVPEPEVPTTGPEVELPESV